MNAHLRTREQRIADTLRKLETEVDVWVASASEDGRANIAPLSFVWHDGALTIAMPATSLTARNLTRAGWARMALGPTRDVVMLDGPIDVLPIGAVPALEDAHARATGFDPREQASAYVYIRLRPERIEAWREAHELAGRQLMEDGAWLAQGSVT
ncbi:MAG: pyridoxamine 5'-phosphate oxidase family protein [Actinomycetota bacterium]|nr:pyridoxamine 5'-phosphate oxidase family protein [Actinomycetota bacterium]